MNKDKKIITITDLENQLNKGKKVEIFDNEFDETPIRISRIRELPSIYWSRKFIFKDESDEIFEVYFLPERIRKRDTRGRYLKRTQKTKRVSIGEDLYLKLSFFRKKAKKNNINVTESDLANIILSSELDTQEKDNYYETNIKPKLLEETKII